MKGSHRGLFSLLQCLPFKPILSWPGVENTHALYSSPTHETNAPCLGVYTGCSEHFDRGGQSGSSRRAITEHTFRRPH